MIDKERVLSKLSELDSYLKELREIKPKNFNEYKNSIEKKRGCERLLHISVECVIDICNTIVADLKLGLPAAEEELFDKLEEKKIISNKMKTTLKKIRKFRNLIVHRYGTVDDKIVFKILENNIKDFDHFKKEILEFLNK